MNKVKTADLIGPALDWAVAYGLNGEPAFFEAFGARMLGRSITKGVIDGSIRPSTDWSQGGHLIEKYRVGIYCDYSPDEVITANVTGSGAVCVGSTFLIAACRAIVAAKLGDEVEIPWQLFTPATQ
jgi:hypothetical protein